MEDIFTPGSHTGRSHIQSHQWKIQSYQLVIATGNIVKINSSRYSQFVLRYSPDVMKYDQIVAQYSQIHVNKQSSQIKVHDFSKQSIVDSTTDSLIAKND